MPVSPVVCPSCRSVFAPERVNTGQLFPCAGCGQRMRVELFPALLRPLTAGAAGEAILSEGEAGCFHHPQKRATVSCASCGRFLCALCDVELDGRHLCPGCIQAGQTSGSLAQLDHQRVLYDRAALLLAVAPLLVWPVTLITAPVAIGLAVWSWKHPCGVRGRSHLEAMLAILLGLAQLAGWGLLAYTLITG